MGTMLSFVIAGACVYFAFFTDNEHSGEHMLLAGLGFFVLGWVQSAHARIANLAERLPPPPVKTRWWQYMKMNLWDPYRPAMDRHAEKIIGAFIFIFFVATCAAFG